MEDPEDQKVVLQGIKYSVSICANPGSPEDGEKTVQKAYLLQAFGIFQIPTLDVEAVVAAFRKILASQHFSNLYAMGAAVQAFDPRFSSYSGTMDFIEYLDARFSAAQDIEYDKCKLNAGIYSNTSMVQSSMAKAKIHIHENTALDERLTNQLYCSLLS